jgi:hypothetical protein
VTHAQPPGGDHDDPLLRAVIDHWDEIEGLASQQQRERLLGLLDGTAEPDPAEARAALADELLDLLPPGHPVIGVLRASVMYSSGAGTDGMARDAVLGRDGGSVVLAPGDADTMPVTVYLADEHNHDQVEAAVEALLAAAGLLIDARDDPVIGSWFRRMVARAKDGARSPAGQDVALSAAHALDPRLVLAQDAEVTARLLKNLAPVLGALQPTRDAVIRTGALLVVKVEWVVSVFQLTAAQQARLDHRPQLARSPYEIIAALSLPEGNRPGMDADRAAVLDLYVEEQVLGQDSRFLRETGVSFGRPQVAPVPDDELTVLAQRRPDLHRLRLTAVVLPFDLEEPPDGCRYLETTVRMTFDSADVRSLRLALPQADGHGPGRPDDSVLDTRGVGRQQLTWKLTARSMQAGLRPSGREVLAVVESPLASVRLTGTLDASVRFTCRLFGLDRKSTAEPRYPLRFTLNVADGTFEAVPDRGAESGQ